MARTCAPKGETPVLQYSFNWKQISAIAGLTFWRFYFRFFPGTIRAPQLVEFLQGLRTQLRGRRALIIWDGLNTHKSRLVRNWLEAQQGEVQIELEHSGRKFRGRGLSTDILEASALAYLAAINRLRSSSARGEAMVDAHSAM